MGTTLRTLAYLRKKAEKRPRLRATPHLVPLKCQDLWDEGMGYVDRNGGKPGQGFPYSTIEGIFLFEGELTTEERRSHPWFVPGYGTHSFKVKKVIKFTTPIYKVQGYVQGRPQALHKTLWLGDKNPTQKHRILGYENLRRKLRDRLERFLVQA